MLAFFGMGLLGSNFVRALRARGEDVQVWNRSVEKAKALEPYGARAFDDPADAARGTTRLHITLSDDAAVDDVLERASPGFAPNLLVVDHTTTSPTGTVARVARARAHGLRFVHAPVFMGPQNALESSGVMMSSGDKAWVDAARPALEKMTGTFRYLGERPDAAAAFKLLGNSFLIALTAGLAETLSLGKALHIEPAQVASLFEFFNPGTMIPARLNRILDAQFSDPSWSLTMARKDARLMMEEAHRARVPLTLLPAIAARMDAVIAEGHGGDDWTVIAKDAL